MSKHDLEQKIIGYAERLDDPDHILGSGLTTKANAMSGPRAAMYPAHTTQAVDLVNPEVAGTTYGYEHLYGEYSGNFVRMESNKVVIGKIRKFSFSDMHYLLVTYDKKNKEYGIVVRKPGEHMSEMFGFKYNNDVIDKMDVGSKMKKGDTVIRATSLDEHGNFMDSLNAKIVYLAEQRVIEDPVFISESFSKRGAVNLSETIQVPLNKNDVPLMLIDGKNFPDVGEKMIDGVLMGTRRDDAKTRQTTMSNKNLTRMMVNDAIFQRSQNYTVVDVDIKCNVPLEEIPDTKAYRQIRMYQEENIRFHQEIYDMLMDVKCECKEFGVSTYTAELSRWLAKARDFLDPGCKMLDSDRLFNNIILNFHLMTECDLGPGFKLTGCFGNKAIISRVVPDEQMPKTADGEVADVVISPLTVLGRINMGQFNEHETGWMQRLIRKDMKDLSIDEAYDLMIKFIGMNNMMHREAVEDTWNLMSFEQQKEFIESVIEDRIHVMDKPIGGITGDDMRAMYEEFKPQKEYLYITDGDGTHRIRRPQILGEASIKILKHIPPTKTSVRNKGGTNPRNGSPIKTMSYAKGKAVVSDQSTRYGEQEMIILMLTNDIDAVNYLLRANSTSVVARQDTSIMNVDPLKPIELYIDNAPSRIANVNNALLKGAGHRINHVEIYEDTGELVTSDDTSEEIDEMGIKKIPKSIRKLFK